MGVHAHAGFQNNGCRPCEVIQCMHIARGVTLSSFPSGSSSHVFEQKKRRRRREKRHEKGKNKQNKNRLIRSNSFIYEGDR